MLITDMLQSSLRIQVMHETLSYLILGSPEPDGEPGICWHTVKARHINEWRDDPQAKGKPGAVKEVTPTTVVSSLRPIPSRAS